MLLLSAGGVDESTGYPGSVQLLPSRALIPPRKAGLAEHDENYGTKSSNPLPSSVESRANFCWSATGLNPQLRLT